MKREKIRSVVDTNVALIIGGILVLLFDLVYNLLQETPKIGYRDGIVLALGFCSLLFGLAQEKIFIISGKIGELFESKPYHILACIVIISIVIRLLFLPERWINPDEGAHLYDAKFVLAGKIPFVDYDSRQPVYVYILAAFLKVFGCSYVSGRLLPLFSTIGIGILVFMIGNKLFDNKRIALLASAIYLFSPLSLLWSIVVKTELPETLFVCIGMFLLLDYIKEEREGYNQIFFSGVFFALAYYVRESAFVIFVAALLFITFVYIRDRYKLIKSSGTVIIGYVSVILIILLYFSSFTGFAATWGSSLNPLNIFMDPFQQITGMVSESTTSGSLGHQPFSGTLSDWKWILKLNSFLFSGIFLFFPLLIPTLIRKRDTALFKNARTSFIFLFLWVLFIFIFYIYYSIRTSFYTPYFGEVLPALVLILASSIIFSVSEIKSQENLKKIVVLVFVIVIALYISSISLISTSFECVWSPETVEDVSHYIKSHSSEDDVLLSGGMIWTFESNTKPFMNDTHPLAFLRGMNEDQIEGIENHMEHNKPKFIVLDGYTEKIYLWNVPKTQDAINETYVLKKEVYDSFYPVKVYELK